MIAIILLLSMTYLQYYICYVNIGLPSRLGPSYIATPTDSNFIFRVTYNMPELEEDKISENSLGPATSETFAQSSSPDDLVSDKDNRSNSRQKCLTQSDSHCDEEAQFATSAEKLELGDKTSELVT